jgi:hypothetical protein
MDGNLILLTSNYREDIKDWDKLTKLQKLKKFLSGEYFGSSLYIYENQKVQPKFYLIEGAQILPEKV